MHWNGKYANLKLIVSICDRIMDRLISARVFITIAESASLTRAAEILDMSRTMVTRHLAQMEAWAGTRLFHRSTRRISLTSAGETTLARCREVLAMAELVPIAGDQAGEQLRGTLRVTTSPSLAAATVTRAVTHFLRQHPETSIDLQVAYKKIHLVEERIDLAIRVTNQLDPGLVARRLGDCHTVVCASPAYLRGHSVPRHAEDLTGHNCLSFAYSGKSQWTFIRDNEQLHIPIAGTLMSNDSMVLLQAALEGLGIIQQPAFMVAPHIARGKLIPLLPDETPISFGIWGLYGSRDYRPALLRAALDFFTDWFSGPGHLD